ncbi:unnamed protein product [Camellia sinensis]
MGDAVFTYSGVDHRRNRLPCRSQSLWLKNPEKPEMWVRRRTRQRRWSPRRRRSRVLSNQKMIVRTRQRQSESNNPRDCSPREEKFQIDLMAPPPQSRSSPEREAEVNFVVTASEHKPAGPEVAAEVRPMMRKDEEDD